MSTGERRTPRWPQIRSANWGWAVPENTTTSFTGGLPRAAAVPWPTVR